MPGSLTRSQINAFFKILLDKSVRWDALDLDEATLKKFTVTLPFKFSIRDSNIFYEINQYWDSKKTKYGYSTQFFPSDQLSAPESSFHITWDSLLDEFGSWAAKVGIELAEPDPWILISQGRFLLE